MKKVLIVSLFLVMTNLIFGLVNIFGMEFPYKQETNFGIKMGVNFSNITGNEDISYDPKGAVTGGIFLEMPISERFCFQPELLFSRKGAAKELAYIVNFDGETIYALDYTLKTDYLELVPLLKVCLNKRMRDPKPFFYFGPSISFNTYAKEEISHRIEIADVTIVESNKYDCSNALTNFDFLMVMGFTLENDKFISDVRFSRSIVDNNDIDDNESVYNNSINCLVGVKF